MRKKVVVLGANFGGLTAALAVKHELEGDVDVTVVSSHDYFLFNPSLIWLPFGKRGREDITFPVAPTFESHDVDFVHASATGIDPSAKAVTTDKGQTLAYDYLVIATGSYNEDDFVPGFKENAVTITTLAEAERAGEAWQRYLDKPGDIVIAASQSAGCFGAAYEFLFNTSYQLTKAGLRKDVKITYVTSEPFLGHFGVGGLPHAEQLIGTFLKKEGIESQVSVGIDHIDRGAFVLSDGEELPFSFSMVVPPFLGQDFLKDVDGLADE
jgi:sulfide:quinone oxidoreductase